MLINTVALKKPFVIVCLLSFCVLAQDDVSPAATQPQSEDLPSSAASSPASTTELSSSETTPDTISTFDGRKAVADLSRDDILNLSYDDLITMPFEILISLADKLEISVEELLSMKMTVASKAGATLREQPGILSVITGDEIRRSGARDMVDVLRLVPGFFFGLDVNGVTGIGLRGNWGHEGKILMLMDGQEMNDLTYYIYPYGNHFPIDQIKRVEIIRGPGSSLYGGAAELGVINIITKHGGDLNGVSASVTVGRFEEKFGAIAEKIGNDEKVRPWDVGRARVNVSLGQQSKDIEFALHSALGLANRSDQEFTSFYFKGYDWTLDRPTVDYAKDQQTEMPSANVNIGIKWHDFSTRLIYDYCKTWGIDASIYDNTYYHWLGELKYDAKLFDGKLVVTPKYNIRRMLSWHGVSDIGNIDYMRNIGGISALADPADWLNLTGGVDFYYDYYKYIFQGQGYLDDLGDSVKNVFWNGKPDISFTNEALFLQGLVRMPWKMNLTLGARAEHHSQYGWAFAPRLGLTQIINDLHFKLLVSKAYRSPTIGALALLFGKPNGEPDLEPEDTWVQEFEAGYRINKNMFVTANIYNIILNNSIGYFDLMSEFGTNPWGYMNVEASTGSWGAELEYTFKHKIANVTCNYSFYSNAGKDRVIASFVDSLLQDTAAGVYAYDTVSHTQFNVPDIDGPYLGAPQHKVGINVACNLWRDLWIAPTLTLMSTTYGYLDARIDTVYNTDDPAVIDEITTTQTLDSIPFTALFNVSLSYENLLVRGLTLTAGVYDVFGTKYPWVQAYNGFGAPISGPSREYTLKLTYNLPVRK